MGGLGSPYGQPGHHSPNGGGSVSSKRTINRSEWESRCLWLSVLPFRSANYLAPPPSGSPQTPRRLWSIRRTRCAQRRSSRPARVVAPLGKAEARLAREGAPDRTVQVAIHAYEHF